MAHLEGLLEGLREAIVGRAPGDRGLMAVRPNAGDRGRNPAGGGGVTPSLVQKLAGAGTGRLPNFVRVR